jgi:hypothetical protein
MKQYLLAAVIGLGFLAGCEAVDFGGPTDDRAQFANESKPVGDASIDSTYRPSDPSANVQINAGPPPTRDMNQR